ncbi:MAG: DinB family protein [Acidimicrobiales bacterium]
MPDQKPPRLEAGERETLLALLGYQRQSLVGKIEGVDEEEARRSPVGSGTSLLWLVKHLARAESTWVLRRFAGSTQDLPPEAVVPSDTVASAVADYRATWERVDAVIAAAPSLDVTCADVGDQSPVNLRWVVSHLLEETARHAGHADILRELIDGQTGR